MTFKGELTAIVTGASGAIGLTLTRDLVAAGYRVVAIDTAIDDSGLLPEVDPQRVRVARVNITREVDVMALAGQVAADFGSVDLLVNNAARDTKVGPGDSGEALDPIEQLLRFPMQEFRDVLDVNLMAPLLMVQAFAPLMRVSRCASIVNIASIYGILAPNHSLYSDSGVAVFKGPDYPASKAGLISLSNYLAVTLAPWGIRSNAVSPGGVQLGQSKRFIQNYSLGTPLARMASVRDVANAVLFLASSESGYITGHNLVVDGGRSVW